MLNGGARFTVDCKFCALRLVVDRIRDPEATAMREHLHEHPELGVRRTAPMGVVFEHYRVTRKRE